MSLRSVFWALIAALAITGPSFAAAGDTWVVNRPTVNLRSGPSTATNIVGKVSKGDTLTETQRAKDWIEVNSPDGKAWIYALLVKSAPGDGDELDGSARQPQQGSVAADTVVRPTPTDAEEKASFRVFKQDFADFNDRLRNSNGEELFTNPKYRGDGVVSITATPRWLAGNANTRESQLEAVYLMWLAANKGRGQPSVQVVDAKGKQQMNMQR